MKRVLAQAAFAAALLTVGAGLSAAPTAPTKPTKPTKPTPPPPGSGGPYGTVVECMADGNSQQYCEANVNGG